MDEIGRSSVIPLQYPEGGNLRVAKRCETCVNTLCACTRHLWLLVVRLHRHRDPYRSPSACASFPWAFQNHLMHGGDGCIFSAIRTADFCLAGAVLTYQLMPKLRIGAEPFHQTAESQGTPASSSVGVGWRYDLSKNSHLLGYVRRGAENTDQTDR